MSRLIDADALVEDIKSCMYDFIGSPEEVDRDIAKHEYAICRINDAPTVEPKEGKWKCEGLLFFCSECKKTAYPSRYCPNCGAKMDEVKE